MSTENPPPPPAGNPPPPPSNQPSAGFFGALFDFTFSNFVTPILIKAIYVIALVVLVLVWIGAVIGGFSSSVGTGLAALIIGPIILVLYLAFIRMTLEIYLAIVRMSEDIHHRLR